MNSTIDFKTAKTIDTMSKKIDHIDDAVTGFLSRCTTIRSAMFTAKRTF